VAVLHWHVRSMEVLLHFGCERGIGLGYNGEKGSHCALEEEDLLASTNSHWLHALMVIHDRGRRRTVIVIVIVIVNGVGMSEDYSDAGHERVPWSSSICSMTTSSINIRVIG
jgi:hypothetical protein